MVAGLSSCTICILSVICGNTRWPGRIHAVFLTRGCCDRGRTVWNSHLAAVSLHSLRCTAMFRPDPDAFRRRHPGSLARGTDSFLVGTVLALAFFCPFVFPLHGAAVTLQWDPDAERDIAGCKVYCRTGKPGPPYHGTSANEGPSPIDAGNVTSFTLTGSKEAETYHVAVTCYDGRARERSYSSAAMITLSATKTASQEKKAENASGSGVLTAPVRLPSGMLVTLNQKQLDVIKEQRGVFFGATATDMLSPGEVVLSLPAQLGGGYLYGRPEHLAQAFVAAKATEGTTPATHLFMKPRSCLW